MNIIGSSILFLLITTSVYGQTSFANAKSSKKAVLTVYYDGMNGLANKNSSGKMTGMLIDVMEAFKKNLKEKHGITATINYSKKPSFKSMMDAVRNGKSGAFALSNISLTEARKKSYAFSLPFLRNVSVMLTNQNTNTLSSMASLASEFKGKTAYSTAGTTNSRRLIALKNKEFPGLKVIMLASTDAAMRKVMADNQAFTMVDLVYYLGNSTYRNKLKRHPVGDDDTGDKFAIAMPKSSDWAQPFNSFFKTYSRASAHKESAARHLGASSQRMVISH